MAVITYEEGNAVPIKTDTSHVFDVNGNPLHGELFIGETIASDDVEEIDGFAHESEVAEIRQDLAGFTSIISVDFPSANIPAFGTVVSSNILPQVPSGMIPIACRLKKTGQSNVLLPYLCNYGSTICVQIFNAYNNSNNQQCTVEVVCIKQPA